MNLFILPATFLLCLLIPVIEMLGGGGGVWGVSIQLL